MSKQDPLMKLINDHEEVSEFLDNLKEIMDFLHDKDAWRKLEPVENFFKRKVIDHFEFEEKNIFPVFLLKIATPKTVELILELQKEHGIIQLKTEEFLKITSKITEPPDEKTRSDLNLRGREIMDNLLIHASKEDDELLPIIEKNKHLFQ